MDDPIKKEPELDDKNYEVFPDNRPEYDDEVQLVGMFLLPNYEEQNPGQSSIQKEILK